MSLSERANAGRPSFFPYLLVAAATVAVDQATKWLVVDRLGPDQPDHRWEVLGDALAVHYVENTGIAFGMWRDRPALVGALVVAAACVVGALAIRAAPRSPVAMLGVALVLAGAAGNLIDRARFGYVVDFISVAVWPKFNIADSAITIGAALLAWRFIIADEKLAEEQPRREWRARGTAPGPIER